MVYNKKRTLFSYIIDGGPGSHCLSMGNIPYRTSAHLFTVLPPIFYNIKNNLYYYIQQKSLKPAWFANKKCFLTTVLPPIKLPCFQTWNYRPSTHTATELSNMFLGISTVLRPIKSASKLLEQYGNKYRKDVLKVVYKNNISVDDLFLKKKKEKIFT